MRDGAGVFATIDLPISQTEPEVYPSADLSVTKSTVWAGRRWSYTPTNMHSDRDNENDANADFKQYLSERALLIDAARESARTFDKAVLTFGSAIFGFSIAFVKDVAPTPARYTLKWLGFSWGLFSFGLLAILLSFLFSHRACMFEIEVGAKQLADPKYQRVRNRWSVATNTCNILSITCMFLGLLCWSVFAFNNIGKGESQMNQPKPSATADKLNRPVKDGYTPPPMPAKSTPPPPPATRPAREK